MRRALFLLLLAATPAWAGGDYAVYALHCSGCHHIDGHGVPEKGVPDLHEAWSYADTPAGRRYLVQVPGIAASRLSDAEAARMLNYVLARFSDGRTGFAAFTAEEVAAARPAMATDAPAVRVALRRR